MQPFLQAPVLLGEVPDALLERRVPVVIRCALSRGHSRTRSRIWPMRAAIRSRWRVDFGAGGVHGCLGRHAG